MMLNVIMSECFRSIIRKIKHSKLKELTEQSHAHARNQPMNPRRQLTDHMDQWRQSGLKSEGSWIRSKKFPNMGPNIFQIFKKTFWFSRQKILTTFLFESLTQEIVVSLKNDHLQLHSGAKFSLFL